jgi:phage gp29-like protein
MIKKKKPESGEIIPSRIQSHWYGSSIRDLTPSRLSSILANLDAGDVAEAMALFDEMEERDLHLGAVTQSRFLAAVAQGREVMPASSRKQDGEVADFVRERFDALPRRHALLSSLMSAITHGFSMAEIVWDVSEGQVIPVDIKPRPQKFFTFLPGDYSKPPLDFPHYADPDVREGVELPREKFIFHRHYSTSGDCLKAGLFRGVSWYYLFTNFTLKDWLTFIDLYGVPMRLGKYKNTTDESSRQALRDAVANLGSDAAAVISDDTTIDFIQNAASGDNSLFMGAAEFFNRQKSKRILGQTLTTETGGSSSGAYALGKVHDGVRRDIVSFDCRSLDETLNTDFVKPLVDFNFGPQPRYPRIVTRLARADEADMRLEQVRKLVDLGAKVPARVVAEITGVQLSGDLDKPLNPRGHSKLKGGNYDD